MKDVQAAFEVGLRFELFLALRLLTDPNSRLHGAWKERQRAKMPPNFYSEFAKLGGSPEVWAILATLRPELPVDSSFPEMMSSLRSISGEAFAFGILNGFIHDEKAARSCLSGKVSLKASLNSSKPIKREWLLKLGLYPYSNESHLVASLERLIADPAQWRKTVLALVDVFWQKVFQSEWARILPALERAKLKKERLFAVTTFEEFFEQALIKAVWGDGAISAIRGGYQIRTRDIERCVFIPSVFNETRLWSSLPSRSGRNFVFFPFFEPEISLSPERVPNDTGRAGGERASDRDPFLVFKALGDATRFAIMKMIARTPMTSSEIAGRLSLTRATVSHHVALLSQAELISRQMSEGQALLVPSRVRIENLPAEMADLWDRPNQTGKRKGSIR